MMRFRKYLRMRSSAPAISAGESIWGHSSTMNPGSKTIRILGIDPGYDRLGIAIIEKPLKGKEILLYSDCVQTSAKDSIYVRLRSIGAEIARILDEFKPD